MAIGTQYIAQHGWACLKPEVRYWRAGDSSDKQQITLAAFDEHEPKVEIITISRRDFEQGLAEERIRRAETQMTLPPWLKALEGMNLSEIDDQPRRISRGKRTHREVVDGRLTAISAAVRNFTQVLNSDSPITVINKFASEVEPAQNGRRFQCWLMTYICCGRNPWSLIENMHNNGKWDRKAEEYLTTRRGRPSKHFDHRPWYARDEKMQEKIEAGYLRFARLGSMLTHVYAQTMLHVFGCEPIKDAKNLKYWRHPKGEPFPTFEQFRYACKKKFRQEVMQTTLYGVVRFRNTLAAIKGRFTEAVANLMEMVAIDASFSKLVPKGLLGDHNVPRLCIVKIVDMASGVTAGVGFALGGEQAKAYNMALFCAAIDKAVWGRLFGMTITNDDIPGQGLPSNIQSDRGKFTANAVAEAMSELGVGRDMSPTYNPQSNATVESKNKREVRARGKPTYLATNMNWVQLVRYSVNEVIEGNRSGSAASRLTPDMADSVDEPTPIEIWKYLDERGRNDSHAISFDEAIRRFLTPVEFKTRDGMLFLKSMRYTSEGLETSSLPTRIRNSDGIVLKGYVIDVMVRFAWVEYEGQLIEVEMQSALRQYDGDMTLEDLGKYDEKVRELNARQRDGRPVAIAMAIQQNIADVGPEAKSTRRLSGTAKMKTAPAKHEQGLARFR